MADDAFFFALLTAGILSLVVGFWGIYLTASTIGYISASWIVFWNVILFAALIAAGGISIGYAVGKRYA
ncbi:MAG: hypothetical protein EFT35_10515 [Methanophagales archaeon ANME-1-THS]|nr:MAG: hypothetical protein EFT35_10515 [Methanophagales archaeon ANME-1-THS]